MLLFKQNYTNKYQEVKFFEKTKVHKYELRFDVRLKRIRKMNLRNDSNMERIE